jgi:hypothetical protein
MIRSIVTGRACVPSRSALPGKDDLQAMWRVRLLARLLRPEALGVAGPLEDLQVFFSSSPRSAARDRSTAAVNARAIRRCRAGCSGFEARRASPCAPK